MTDALSLLRPGELCIVVIDGKQREAEWIAANRWFHLMDQPVEIATVDEVEEWRPASVHF
jgi:hypothetical protein